MELLSFGTEKLQAQSHGQSGMAMCGESSTLGGNLLLLRDSLSHYCHLPHGERQLPLGQHSFWKKSFERCYQYWKLQYMSCPSVGTATSFALAKAEQWHELLQTLAGDEMRVGPANSRCCRWGWKAPVPLHVAWVLPWPQLRVHISALNIWPQLTTVILSGFVS